jgi:bacteriorhodopsin
MNTLEAHTSETKNTHDKLNSKIKNNDRLVSLTFYITYVFLMTTATITFIESISTTDSKIRHILNLETCISVVATFFYSKFVRNLDIQNINYKEININRYTDWMITTPLMLWVLCLAFVYNTKSTFNVKSFVIILLLNFAMILTGYFGEIGYIENRLMANGIGFAFFAALYGYIYYKYLYKKDNFDNKMIYGAFVVLWAFYGVFYQMEEKTRNVGYNILDLLSKCFVGIFFWAYFTKSLVL